VAVAGLASGAALAAPGDLDPSFGQVGRRSDIDSPGYANLRSVDVRPDDSVIFGGGADYDGYYGSYVDEFVGSLLPDGTADAGFAAATVESAAVFDTALQPDGKVVGVGIVQQPDGRKKLLLFRLLPSGALDTGFGLNGLVVVSDGTSNREAAYSVIVEPAGKIVVAGGRSNSLLVARMEPNGTLDASFGTGGIFVGSEVLGDTVRIASAPTGGYRLVAMVPYGGMGWDCNVIGLTAAGAIDTTFGTNGYAALPGSDGDHACSSLAIQADGRIVLGGLAGVQGFVHRLLANGSSDTTFDAASVPARLQGVSALAVGATGKIFVAGGNSGLGAGAQVIRLLANGAVDPLYGVAGVATVDPELRRSFGFWITDLKVASNDAVVLAGNTYSFPLGGQGFVARLLGDTGGGGPGVFSVVEPRVLATESGGQAVVKVRRTGGSTGAVAVTYDTRGFPWITSSGGSYSPGASASVDDFTATTGRLTWADGDASEREIVVPVTADAQTERPEWFEVLLISPEGGAGLGFHSTEVEIAGSSYPYGNISISGSSNVAEGDTAYFYVSRDFYRQGAVSVTLRVAAGGTATAGDDFRNSGSSNWQDVVLTWDDGDSGTKEVRVTAVADGTTEGAESFTLELVSPTGGALVGPVAQATVQINAQSGLGPVNPDSSGSRSGGGAFGALGALLLGCCGMLRRFVPRLQAARRRA
jgi:uncharacterized delta-60 repeat protein